MSSRTQAVGYINAAQSVRAVDESHPLPVTLAASGSGVTPTDAATLAITTGGTSQTVFAANAARRSFIFQNISDSAMWLNFSAAAAADAPSIYVAAGAYFEPFVAPTTSISVFCATTGKKFTAKEA